MDTLGAQQQKIGELLAPTNNPTVLHGSFSQRRQSGSNTKALEIKSERVYFMFPEKIQLIQNVQNKIQLHIQTLSNTMFAFMNDPWCSLNLMEQTLSIFDRKFNIFKQDASAKHLVLPAYSSVMKKMHHYAFESPNAWTQELHPSIEKLHKYKYIEMHNNDTPIATHMDTWCYFGLLQLALVSPPFSKEIIETLSQKN
ncbi:hypothetical protein O181_088512 [Austropuccinia psidii MF-1]|uniref:Uncharacterized protein n=1 Tax=Austropuccinia psidii MF-1 TaxID=1389203 RepID=A0A9Q3P582_9BASI|nr:hypothetical protein [Austropuccinia psidii MF-1]